MFGMPEHMTREQLIERYRQVSVLAESMETIVAEKEATIKHMESQMAEMQLQIDQLKRLYFGAKRERFVKNKDDDKQLTLPFDLPEQADPEKDEEVITYVHSKQKRKNHPGRLTLPFLYTQIGP